MAVIKEPSRAVTALCTEDDDHVEASRMITEM